MRVTVDRDQGNGFAVTDARGRVGCTASTAVVSVQGAREGTWDAAPVNCNLRPHLVTGVPD